MLLGILYLGAVLITVACLVRLKYYVLWPILTAQVAVTAWQAAVTLIVPLADGTIAVAARRSLAIHWWLPGDVALLVLTAAAVIEALWRGLGDFPTRHKVGMCASEAAGMVFVGLCLRWILDIPHSTDWYRQVLSDRVIVNLCIAGAALIAFGLAETFLHYADPRYVRFHAGLLATLTIGHVVFGDFAHWGASHDLYRALVCMCLLGWAINAHLLRLETAGLIPRTPARADVSTPQTQAPLAVAVRGRALAEQGATAYRRGELQAHVWPPEAHAKTR